MPVYCLVGEQENLASAWLEDNLKNWVESAWRPFSYHVLEAEKVSPEEFSNLIQSFPMGSPYRVVVVKNLYKTDDTKRKSASQSSKSDTIKRKAIPQLAKAALESTILIFYFVPCPADLKKLTLEKEWEEILKIAEVVKFNMGNEGKAKWLEQAAKTKNIKLTKESQAFLLESAGENLRKLELELEKIATFSPSAQKTDLEALVGNWGNSTLYDLLDGLGEKKSQKAFRALQDLIEQGEPPLKILAALAGQIRLYWQIKCLLEEKKSAQDITKTLGIHPYRVTKGIGHARNFKTSEFPMLADWLMKADWSIKTGRQQPQHVLELILARACS